ncbi:hypothetical protein PR048_019549, partial [Dryococelus australis]
MDSPVSYAAENLKRGITFQDTHQMKTETCQTQEKSSTYVAYSKKLGSRETHQTHTDDLSSERTHSSISEITANAQNSQRHSTVKREFDSVLTDLFDVQNHVNSTAKPLRFDFEKPSRVPLKVSKMSKINKFRSVTLFRNERTMLVHSGSLQSYCNNQLKLLCFSRSTRRICREIQLDPVAGSSRCHSRLLPVPDGDVESHDSRGLRSRWTSPEKTSRLPPSRRITRGALPVYTNFSMRRELPELQYATMPASSDATVEQNIFGARTTVMSSGANGLRWSGVQSVCFQPNRTGFDSRRHSSGIFALGFVPDDASVGGFCRVRAYNLRRKQRFSKACRRACTTAARGAHQYSRAPGLQRNEFPRAGQRDCSSCDGLPSRQFIEFRGLCDLRRQVCEDREATSQKSVKLWRKLPAVMKSGTASIGTVEIHICTSVSLIRVHLHHNLGPPRCCQQRQHTANAILHDDGRPEQTARRGTNGRRDGPTIAFFFVVARQNADTAKIGCAWKRCLQSSVTDEIISEIVTETVASLWRIGEATEHCPRILQTIGKLPFSRSLIHFLRENVGLEDANRTTAYPAGPWSSMWRVVNYEFDSSLVVPGKHCLPCIFGINGTGPSAMGLAFSADYHAWLVAE